MTNLQTLGRAVKVAQWRHHRTMDARLAEIGTTLVQWDALRAIERDPGSSAHDLAQETFQSDQSFGTLASRLAAQGLIERRPGRGRRIEHHISADGAAMVAAGRPIAEEVLATSFAALSGAERAVLLDLLTRVGAGL